jgi:hypothetical protein
MKTFKKIILTGVTSSWAPAYSAGIRRNDNYKLFLPGELQGGGKELHEGRGGGAGLHELVHEVRGIGILLAELGEKGEVLVFQGLGKLVVGRESLGRALELLSFQGATLLEGLIGQGGLPLAGMVQKIGTDLVQDGHLGMPNAPAAEDLPGGEVDVIAGGMDILLPGQGEMGRHMGLVGGLVLGEPGVPINTEHGAAGRTVVHDQVRADLPHGRSQFPDEVQEGIADVLLVSFLVGLEPRTVIVPLELFHETEERGCEIGLFHKS